MPPRTRARGRGTTLPGASDEASARPPSPTPRGSGRGGRGRLRGHSGRARVGRTENPEAGVAPTPNMAELMASVQGLQRTVETLIGAMAEQRRPEGEPHSTQGPQGNEGQVEQQPVTGGGSTRVSYSEFVKLEPPTFSGSDASEDPQQFLDGISRVCRALGCSSQRMVQLAEFRLRDVAQAWFEGWLRGRPQMPLDPTWEEFREFFMERFLPESVRKAKAREFEDLRQIPSMSVSEYDIRFTQLSRYAPYLVPTERMRIERFIEGLVMPLYRAVAPQMKTFPSYAAAVDCARMIEMKEMEMRASQERAKKFKIGGNFSGQSSGTYGKGSKSQAPQGGSQWSSRSNMPISSSSQGARSEQRGQSQVSRQSSGQVERVRPPCQTCGKLHSGQCRLGARTCFQCGQVGHLKRDCPQLQRGSSQGSVQPALPSTPIAAQPVRQFPTQPGRGNGGRGQGGRTQGQPGRGQARVFALTP